MLVVDWERSEHGSQRRKTAGGRLLHCCCICGVLAPWGDDWSTYCSVKDLDDCAPIPKFCSTDCRARGGSAAVNVTDEMKQKAKDSEWRSPEAAYRGATGREKYNAAASEQRRERRPTPESQ